MPCANPEGYRGPDTLENHKEIGILSTTGRGLLENPSEHKGLIEIVKNE